ncbi:MAG: hypothetical protein ABSE53_05640 [Terracidiphilus sp.]|jgi:hypothetical protein
MLPKKQFSSNGKQELASEHERVGSLIEHLNNDAIEDCQRASISPAEVKSCLEESARLGWEDVTGQFFNDDHCLEDIKTLLLLFKKCDLDWTFRRRVKLKPGRGGWVNRRYIWDLKDGSGKLRGVGIDASLTRTGVVVDSFAFYTSKTVQYLLLLTDRIINEGVCIREGLEQDTEELKEELAAWKRTLRL